MFLFVVFLFALIDIIIPNKIMYDIKLLPPYDINGRVIPVIGNKPIVMEMFCICWYIRAPAIPDITALLVLVFNIIISKQVIDIIKIRIPVSPYILENEEKIKSVCPSGKYNSILAIPFPNNPLDPIDITEFSNWIPDLLFQSNILSNL